MLYVVESARPVMVNGDVVDAGLKAIHVVPPSIEYW
jgi:hypothetical protein